MSLKELMKKVTEQLEPVVMKCESNKLIISYIYLMKKYYEYESAKDIDKPEILKEINETFKLIKSVMNIDIELKDGACECSELTQNSPAEDFRKYFAIQTGLPPNEATKFIKTALSNPYILFDFVINKNTNILDYYEISKPYFTSQKIDNQKKTKQKNTVKLLELTKLLSEFLIKKTKPEHKIKDKKEWQIYLEFIQARDAVLDNIDIVRKDLKEHKRKEKKLKELLVQN